MYLQRQMSDIILDFQYYGIYCQKRAHTMEYIDSQVDINNKEWTVLAPLMNNSLVSD